ncbi:MAG: tyrosine--tRNA ligase [Candidatus Omnitrophica bacterium]|nr:tyrosine--tRNA ligase [Candidatus Omnitrophota bacterium]
MDLKKQLEIIKRGAVEVVSEEELAAKLELSIKEKRPLNIKAGFDPTAPDIHLGHTVLLRKLRQFQDLGHNVYFLIGDFTARIGDPTGRNEARKRMTKEEVAANAVTYKKQVGRILDLDKIKVVFNSEWFDSMSIKDMLELTAHVTVSQMLVRADFKKRLGKGEDVSLVEFLYPVLQGYDSAMLKADIELGGTDQIFNLLTGRDIQKDHGQTPQVVLTMPLLEGTDGIQKMSKSYGNYIGINEDASSMFGKIMSISDEMMLKYYTLLTDEDLEKVKAMHPKDAKVKLAQIIITQYHSQEAAEQAKGEFEKVFSKKELPEDISTLNLSQPKSVLDVMAEAELSKSRNESRRLIKQNAVEFNNARITDENYPINTSGVLKVGSRRFVRIEYKP